MNFSNKKIAVIGYGIAGRVLSFRLAQTGAKITVFQDPNEDPNASFAAQGLSSVKGLFFARSNLFGMKLEGHNSLKKLLIELETLSGVTLHKENCVFEPYIDDLEKWKLIRRVYRSQFTALYNKTELAPPDFLRETVRGCLYYPADFIYDSEKLMNILHLENSNKVESFMDTKVLKIEIGTETADIFSADKKFERFDHVVLAAGAHVETILEGSGYGTKKNRRISGSTLQVSKNTSQDFAVIAGKHSIVSFLDKISIGATSLNLSQSHNEGKEKQDLENLLGEFDEYLPNLSLNVQNYRIRRGVRLCYENMVPRIEWLNCSKNTRCVFVVSGLYKNGYQFSPLAFQIMNQS